MCLAIWSVAVSRPWYAPYFLSLHCSRFNFFLDNLMSHQTLTARHNQQTSSSSWTSPVSFSRLEEEPTIFHFVLAWREGFPEIPRESRGVKGLGRVIGVFYHLLWTHKRACIRSTTLLSWPSTPLHGVHFCPRHFEVSSGLSSTQTLTARCNQSLFPDWKSPVSFSPERRASDFQIVLAC